MSDVQKPEGKKIVSDDWLSKLIGKPVYHLQDFLNSFEKKDLPENQMFIWSKIPVDDIKKLTCLQKLGFYLVDTNIQFSLSEEIILKYSSNVRFAQPSDEFAVRALAKNSFKYNRFNNDPNITEEIACKIKEDWAGNFFSGKRGKWMVVIEQNSKLVGFLQLIDKNHDTIVIDLIAVDEKNRGKGLAKEMISYAYVNCLKNNVTMEVGTQIANTASIELYLKLGFHMNTASYVLHMHQ
jgi:ribosomal protein S18 acetylase RimI-like enzyme